MQYPVDPALLGQQICQILATSFEREILLQIANTLGVAWGQISVWLLLWLTKK